MAGSVATTSILFLLAYSSSSLSTLLNISKVKAEYSLAYLSYIRGKARICATPSSSVYASPDCAFCNWNETTTTWHCLTARPRVGATTRLLSRRRRRRSSSPSAQLVRAMSRTTKNRNVDACFQIPPSNNKDSKHGSQFSRQRRCFRPYS